MPYAELCARTSFSFLEGASKPDELVRAAASRGVSHLGVVDRDGVYGLVQAHRVARELGVHLICGSMVTITGSPGVVLLVMNEEGWTHLCRLLTLARARGPKGWAAVSREVLCAHAGGLLCLLRYGWQPENARPLLTAFEGRLGVAWSRQHTSLDRRRERWVEVCSDALGVPVVATNDVVFHDPDRQPLADVLTCVRRRVPLEEAGRALHLNGERYLLEEGEFRARYARRPEAIQVAMEWARRCTFSLQSLRYRYPHEVVPSGYTPMGWLTLKVKEGLGRRYPQGAPDTVRDQVSHELSIIDELGFPSYFLTVYDIVCFAQRRGILCQGRGSAANSAVCFALGITSVDPAHSALLFERFISKERGEPPDIDVDFEHERREEVIQYIYDRYGRDRAGMVCAVITYRSRSAVRDAGRAIGLSLDQVSRLCGQFGRGAGTENSLVARVREAGLDPSSREITQTLELAQQLRGFPRHLSIHTGGFVIADRPLTDLVPIEPASMPGRTVVQWDKDDLEALGFVKVDVLALGMLTCIRKSFEEIEAWTGEAYTLATVPAEDEAVYEMFCQADTVGVFQIESRAQMSMLPRLQPRCFYDLVIEVALVRPGPIQGGMVHPYLRRRRGLEPVTYAHPDLKPILERTLGVPLFQEQVMAMAVKVGGFTPGQADALRRAMSTWKRRGALEEAGRELVDGMIRRGIEPPFAEAVYQQLLGFGEYGFPESHAASFARLVYISGWLKCRHPEAFLASLINSQPMGFYSVRALLEDGRRHGLEVRPVCVQRSAWDASLERMDEEGLALRLGFRQVRGMGRESARAIEEARASGGLFQGVLDLARRARVPRKALKVLSSAGALGSLDLSRRASHWAVQGLRATGPLMDRWVGSGAPSTLKEESPQEALWEDLHAVGWSGQGHPLEGFRVELEARGCVTLAALRSMPSGAKVLVAGLVSSRQRPKTANGVVFMALEDETGMLNVVIWPSVWDRFRQLARHMSALCVEGTLQREGLALSLVARSFRRIFPAQKEARDVGHLPISSHDFH